jgi:hypothetical protein
MNPFLCVFNSSNKTTKKAMSSNNVDFKFTKKLVGFLNPIWMNYEVTFVRFGVITILWAFYNQ